MKIWGKGYASEASFAWLNMVSNYENPINGSSCTYRQFASQTEFYKKSAPQMTETY
jgi:hypothetical protein